MIEEFKKNGWTFKYIDGFLEANHVNNASMVVADILGTNQQAYGFDGDTFGRELEELLNSQSLQADQDS